jgi:hypothetical protein
MRKILDIIPQPKDVDDLYFWERIIELVKNGAAQPELQREFNLWSASGSVAESLFSSLSALVRQFKYHQVIGDQDVQRLALVQRKSSRK